MLKPDVNTKDYFARAVTDRPYTHDYRRWAKMELIEVRGFPHQSADWFGMTVVFDGFRTDLGADSF